MFKTKLPHQREVKCNCCSHRPLYDSWPDKHLCLETRVKPDITHNGGTQQVRDSHNRISNVSMTTIMDETRTYNAVCSLTCWKSYFILFTWRKQKDGLLDNTKKSESKITYAWLEYSGTYKGKLTLCTCSPVGNMEGVQLGLNVLLLSHELNRVLCMR